MKRLLCLLIVFTSLAIKAQGIFSISGTVSDEKGNPVPGATVFIANSKFIMATSNDGAFSLSNVQPGTYELVIKMLGYDTFIENVTVRDGSVKVTAELTPHVITLNTVNITASRKNISFMDRVKYLSWFTRDFLGETPNARQCWLANPDVLKFDYDNDTKILKASADEFLIVTNKALGYTLKYALTTYELDLQNNTSTIGGYPYFEEMKGTTAEQKKWEENRRVAYLSSERHFFRSLVDNTLTKEGFLAYMITNDTTFIRNPAMRNKGFVVNDAKEKKLFKAFDISDARSLFVTDDAYSKTLIVPRQINGADTTGLDRLYVVYTGEKEPPLFNQTGNPVGLFNYIKEILNKRQKNNRQISQFIPLADTVTIDRNGGLTPQKSFKYFNYWAWLKIADLTPLDYFVESGKAADGFERSIDIRNPPK